jgi:hypothetical protein
MHDKTIDDLCTIIYQTARVIPEGSEYLIRGVPISSYNMAHHMIRVLRAYQAGNDIYPLLCCDPPDLPTPDLRRPTPEPPKQCS